MIVFFFVVFLLICHNPVSICKHAVFAVVEEVLRFFKQKITIPQSKNNLLHVKVMNSKLLKNTK